MALARIGATAAPAAAAAFVRMLLFVAVHGTKGKGQQRRHGEANQKGGEMIQNELQHGGTSFFCYVSYAADHASSLVFMVRCSYSR